MPEEKITTGRKPSTSAEAEADARAMLQANGTPLLPDRSALQQLLDQMPQTESAVLTYVEFRQWAGISKSTFYRWEAEQKLPVRTLMGGTKLVIKREDAEAWLHAQQVIKPSEPAVVVLPMPKQGARRLRVVCPKPAEQVPRLFQAAPVPKASGKRRGRPRRTASSEPTSTETEDSDAHAARTRFLYAHEYGHYALEYTSPLTHGALNGQ
jgi:predicted DNA-binding transcriptional regulator AlpA